jgi:hypothetical protein
MKKILWGRLMKNKKAKSNDLVKADDLVPLGTYLASVDDFYILESLQVIRMKSVWNRNSATEALKQACLEEWRKRHGDAAIYEVELSDEVKAQIAFENDNKDY